MRRLSPVLGGAILLLAGAEAASAADLGAPPPQVYAPPPQVFSWNGFYIGGNAGYGWNTGSGTMVTTAGSDPFSFNGSGFVGGGQAGINWQWGCIVFGMEADFQGTSGSGPFTDGGLLPLNSSLKDPWFGTFRGRLGYTWDRVMVYATGGGVYGDLTQTGTSGATAFSTSNNFVTWTAGAGIEAAFWGPLSAKVEYLYVGWPSSLPNIPAVTSFSGNAHTNLVRVGLNYHF